ncbi:sulfite exporter TauE/SafE family protein [Rossellomorea vietnamensis]|uniref:sulfite exporter TauE/SafE family protein n=1 Tax=Rossellomorea vietnamensis TaxID=218284 RepID=UPI001E3550F9|nr:sulfite exporter TauE/SafE family protein [Rossellomorea vietnamensis]MCC5800783.1 sulfite exporter TauE/SafE family protein [Rossellomorea vietnamensis]
MILLYFLVGFTATLLGALTGIGGGVIIKPILDTMGTYDAGTVSTLSAATVFAMAAISLLKKKRSEMELNWRVSLLLAAGSIVGGMIGKSVFNQLLTQMTSDDITVIQSTLLIGMLALVLLNSIKRFSSYHVTFPFLILMVGLTLGALSGFLGIGGGPLNVAILMVIFSMDIKSSAINSILIIFFSQLSTLVTIFLTTGYGLFDLSMIAYMIGGGLLGGYMGTIFSPKIARRQINTLFNITLVIIIMMNIYTITRVMI